MLPYSLLSASLLSLALMPFLAKAAPVPNSLWKGPDLERRGVRFSRVIADAVHNDATFTLLGGVVGKAGDHAYDHPHDPHPNSAAVLNAKKQREKEIVKEKSMSPEERQRREAQKKKDEAAKQRAREDMAKPSTGNRVTEGRKG